MEEILCILLFGIEGSGRLVYISRTFGSRLYGESGEDLPASLLIGAREWMKSQSSKLSQDVDSGVDGVMRFHSSRQ
jgi:hypothetical protein